MKLAEFHVDCVVLLNGLKHMSHGSVNYEKQGWAQVGQVGQLWAKKTIIGMDNSS